MSGSYFDSEISQYFAQYLDEWAAAGEVFMKKLAVLILLGVFVCEGTSATEPILKGYQDLKYYQARSLDEEKIVKLVLDYQKACNLYDPKGVLAVYLPGAIIKVRMKDGRPEHLATKEEYFNIVVDNIALWKMYSLKLKLFTPQKIEVEGNNAKLKVPFIIYSTPQDYWEKGIFNFDFRKVDSGWFISRNTWKILDLFYNP